MKMTTEKVRLARNERSRKWRQGENMGRCLIPSNSRGLKTSCKSEILNKFVYYYKEIPNSCKEGK